MYFIEVKTVQLDCLTNRIACVVSVKKWNRWRNHWNRTFILLAFYIIIIIMTLSLFLVVLLLRWSWRISLGEYRSEINGEYWNLQQLPIRFFFFPSALEDILSQSTSKPPDVLIAIGLYPWVLLTNIRKPAWKQSICCKIGEMWSILRRVNCAFYWIAPFCWIKWSSVSQNRIPNCTPVPSWVNKQMTHP